MAKRTKSTKAKELTIRVSAEERRAIEGAAGADHLPASTWARQVVLRRVDEVRREQERREERKRVGRELAAMLQSLPDDSAHGARWRDGAVPPRGLEAVTRTLLDTSFFIAVERRDLQALERFSELLEG